MKKLLSILLIACMALLALPGAATASGERPGSASAETAIELTEYGPVDMTRWQYNEASDVYWQVGISYCADPADASYENLGIFVPGAYMTGTPNGDGTYACAANETGTVGSFTAATAPVVFPVNTPGHSAQSAPTGYVSGAAKYTAAGFVYVSAGCRGKDVGAPAGVIDLKAAIRYIRQNLDILPGNTERFVAFGMSGGGSQTAVLGASGDSELYAPYLDAIGAAEDSDAIAAAMCWCPITGLDSVDEGHEWSMGVTRTDLDAKFQSYSDALAAAYADYVNTMGFTDAGGTVLTLEPSTDGIYQAGSYYDYVKRVIEESLEHYLADNELGQEYIDGLNADGAWVQYDAETNTVTITSIADFSLHCKKATKPVAAFDKLEQGGHQLFNTGDGENVHFDAMLYEIIKGTEYQAEFDEDFALTDSVGNTVVERLFLFSPLSYLLPANEAYGTASVAEHWRIRSGIFQSDTPLTSELNLALALQMFGADVDFETVWGLGHTQAERTGNSDENFIAWVQGLWV